MNSLSKEKLGYYKQKKKLTNKEISELTGLPISTVDKLFSGLTKNPTLETLRKIANVLSCSIDDFIDYERDPLEGHYFDRQTSKIAETIQYNRELKKLLEKLIDLPKEDLKLLSDITMRFLK